MPEKIIGQRKIYYGDTLENEIINLLHKSNINFIYDSEKSNIERIKV